MTFTDDIIAKRLVDYLDIILSDNKMVYTEPMHEKIIRVFETKADMELRNGASIESKYERLKAEFKNGDVSEG